MGRCPVSRAKDNSDRQQILLKKGKMGRYLRGTQTFVAPV